MTAPVHLILTASEEKLSPRQSHFWGNPGLPSGVPYPTYTDDEGKTHPYVFVCQFNLKDLAPYDTDHLLPGKGLLSFFAKIDNYLGYDFDSYYIGGTISEEDAVKVLYFPDCDDLEESEFAGEEDAPYVPEEQAVRFSPTAPPLSDEHFLFAPPTHCPWETWDAPCEDWSILLQVDSCSGDDFELNFMDTGVLEFLIAPSDLKEQRFDRVRAIVLSS